jgi:hypothetical protein
LFQGLCIRRFSKISLLCRYQLLEAERGGFEDLSSRVLYTRHLVKFHYFADTKPLEAERGGFEDLSSRVLYTRDLVKFHYFADTKPLEAERGGGFEGWPIKRV